MTINFCKEMGCPFNGPKVVGCTKYAVAGHCPVIYKAPGEIRPGVQCLPNSSIPESQYWILLDDGADLSEFTAAYDQFLNSPEIQKRLKTERQLKGEAE